MANRDYDDRGPHRGGPDGFGRDREGYGQGHGQGRQQSQFNERPASFDRRDQWMGSGGGSPTQGRADRGMGRVNFGQDHGYDNFGGGAFRAGAEFAASQEGQGSGRGQDESFSEADERQGRARGAMGGTFGGRDYGDDRAGRDRSLLGEVGSMLGFGSHGRDGGQGYRQDPGHDPGRDPRQGYRPEARQGEGHGHGFRQGYPQEGGQGLRRGMGPRNYVRSDARIEEDVNERLSHGHLDATDVEVKVEGGEVTLAGTVRSRGDKRLAEDLADDVMGVRHVQNNLRVQDNWTAGGSAPGFGGGASRGPVGGPVGGPVDGPVVGGSGSASNVVTGQDASQMAGQSPGQPSAASGSLGHSGQPGAKDEPSTF